MAGDVDDVVHAPQDAEVAVRRLHRAIAGEVGPVVPVFAAAVAVVLGVILLDEALAVAPDGLEDTRPRIADADVAGAAGARFDLFALFVVDSRIDARHRRTCATRLHGIDGGLGAAQKAAGLGLPPGVHD